MFVRGTVISVQSVILWCDFQDVLGNCHSHIVVNDLVFFVPLIFTG